MNTNLHMKCARRSGREIIFNKGVKEGIKEVATSLTGI